jgi:hypothetical protein
LGVLSPSPWLYGVSSCNILIVLYAISPTYYDENSPAVSPDDIVMRS